MRERQAGQQRQRAARLAQPGFAPTDERQPEVVPPVVGLERHRPAERRHRVHSVAGAVEDEAVRRPRFAAAGVETAGLARVARRRGQRRQVGRPAGARRFELHHASVGQADVGDRIGGAGLQHGFERGPRPGDAAGIERLQRGPALHPGAMRGDQRLELGVAGASRLGPYGSRRSGSPVAARSGYRCRRLVPDRARGAAPKPLARDCCRSRPRRARPPPRARSWTRPCPRGRRAPPARRDDAPAPAAPRRRGSAGERRHRAGMARTSRGVRPPRLARLRLSPSRLRLARAVSFGPAPRGVENLTHVQILKGQVF